MKYTINEVYEYLTLMRDCGEINMMGAAPYLEDQFDMTKTEARAALFAWMNECRKGVQA
jgi:hypothetical protein